MINWLRTKLHNFIFPSTEPEAKLVAASVEETGFRDDHSLRFDVTSARGGVILSMRFYDSRTDRTHYQNYVIPDGEDVATSVAHIISMELLRKS